MLIAHTTDQSFLGNSVFSNYDRRVLVHQTVQSSGDLLFLAFLFSINGTSIHRQRECDRRKQNRRILIAERIARRCKLQFSSNADITGNYFFHRDLSFTAHCKNTADTFFFFTAGIINHAVGFDRTRKYSKETQPAHKRIGCSFENQSGHRRVSVADLFFFGFRIRNDKIVQDRRIGKVDDRVHNTAQANIFICASAKDRENNRLTNALDQAVHNFLIADSFAFQITHHAVIVSLDSSFDHFFMRFFGVLQHIFRNVHFDGIVAVSFISLHFIKIDNAAEIGFLAER